jgi:hypothetical protein
MAGPNAKDALNRAMRRVYTNPSVRIRFHYCLRSAPAVVHRTGDINGFKWLQKRYPALDLTRYVALQLTINEACEGLVNDVMDHAYWKAAKAWYTESALEELTNFLQADKKAKLPVKARRRASAAESTQHIRQHRNNIGQSRPVVNVSSALVEHGPSFKEPELPDAPPLLSGAGLLEHASSSSHQPEDAPAPLVKPTRRLRNCPLWVSRDLGKKGMSCNETLATSSLRPSFATFVFVRGCSGPIRTE